MLEYVHSDPTILLSCSLLGQLNASPKLAFISTMGSQLSPRQFRLPDLFVSCSLKASTNPQYKEASAESRTWINSFNVFTDRKRADFIQGQNELLCSYVYSYAGYEQFRTTCDFVSLVTTFFISHPDILYSGQPSFHCRRSQRRPEWR